jgi:hypothetical protein
VKKPRCITLCTQIDGQFGFCDRDRKVSGTFSLEEPQAALGVLRPTVKKPRCITLCTQIDGQFGFCDRDRKVSGTFS